MKTGKVFTAKKAMFLNMKEDNLIIRSTSFKNKRVYSRKTKHKD